VKREIQLALDLSRLPVNRDPIVCRIDFVPS
jgi:hypothetical protein